MSTCCSWARARPLASRSAIVRSGASGSPVIILNTDDIVLAKIASGLHLDQLKQDLAGVFQPVHGADRDVDRLVLVHGLDEFVDGDARGAAHDDPVLGTMI